MLPIKTTMSLLDGGSVVGPTPASNAALAAAAAQAAAAAPATNTTGSIGTPVPISITPITSVTPTPTASTPYIGPVFPTPITPDVPVAPQVTPAPTVSTSFIGPVSVTPPSAPTGSIGLPVPATLTPPTQVTPAPTTSTSFIGPVSTTPVSNLVGPTGNPIPVPAVLTPPTQTPQQQFNATIAAMQNAGAGIGSNQKYTALVDQQVAQAQAVAAKPIMSAAQAAGGGVVKWIGGVGGYYEIVMPTGSALTGSVSAGWEPGRNPPGVSSSVGNTGIQAGTGATVPFPGTTNSPFAVGGTNTSSTTSTVGTTSATTSTGATTSATTSTVTSAVTSSTTGAANISDATKDAFAALKDLFNSYGLSALSDEIAGYMTAGKTAGEALIALKTNPTGAYATRFAGNFARTAKGLNVLPEATYLANEAAYAETLKAYGLGNMLSTDPKANAAMFATYISNDVSPVEFKDRIATVEDRIINADPATKSMFQQWYPSLTDKDLVAYFLNPAETIGKLKEKVTSAEIGAAFTGQGLSTNAASATGLAQYGIDRAGALQGAAQIADVLPTSSKLSSIYGEAGINYTQASGEAEFLKTNVAAAEQRKRLKSMERGKFMGDSGVSSQAGSLAKTTQGQF